MAQVGDCLPKKHEALSSNSIKKERKGRKEGGRVGRKKGRKEGRKGRK
jgi:hypothetical protein